MTGLKLFLSGFIIGAFCATIANFWMLARMIVTPEDG